MREAAASVLSEDTAFTIVKGDPDAPVFHHLRTCQPAFAGAVGMARSRPTPGGDSPGHMISVLARSPSSWRRRCGRPPC